MEKNNNLNEAFLEVLAESPLFREIEKKELRAMLVCLGGQIKNIKGTSIFRWGDTVSKIGFVLKGNVHVLRETYWERNLCLDGLVLVICLEKSMPVCRIWNLTEQLSPRLTAVFYFLI